MLRLRYSIASPYARKVRIAAAVAGLSAHLDIEGVDFTDPADSLFTQNPLGKIPTLILEDGSALYDSRVIVEYLDQLAGGGKLIPLEPSKRIEALRMQALGDGINDAALLLRYEMANRPEALRHPPTIALQQGKIDRALRSLEESPPVGALTIGPIAIACALGYLDLRFEGAWRLRHARLVEWLDDFAREVPSFDATKS